MKTTHNKAIAHNGLWEQLFEVEYQRSTLSQTAFDIRKAIELPVEEEINLGYDIVLGNTLVPIGMILEVFRMMDDYTCEERTILDNLEPEVVRTRKSLRLEMVYWIGNLLERTQPGEMPEILKNRGMRKSTPEEKLKQYSKK